MGNAAFNKKKPLFSSKFELILRKKAVKCYILSTALCGAETGTVRNVDQEYAVSLEKWCWRRME
jgi:hypothetical protein